MIGELIPTGYTYDSGRTAINYAFSGAASFNILSGETIYSGATDLSFLFQLKGEDIYTRVQGGTNISTGGTASVPIVNLDDDISLNSITATTVSASTLYSGTTDLSNIFQYKGEDIYTRVQGGTNISTGGTASVPIVNLDDDIILNSISATTISATTFYLNTTDLNNILNNKYDKTGGTINGNVVIINDLFVDGNFTVYGTATTIYTETIQVEDNNIELNFSGNHATAIGGGIILLSGQSDGSHSTILSDSDGNWIIKPALSSSTISASTFYSGSTDLSNIFASIENIGDVTRVQGGTNINTGGTDNYPIINLDDDIILNSISATTISATTYYSGTTELSNVFQEKKSKTFITLIDDSTVSWDYSQGYNAVITLTGASGTLSISNVENGDYGTIKIIQDASGNRSMNLPASSKVANGGGGSITFTSNPNAVDFISFSYDGVNFWWDASYNYT